MINSEIKKQILIKDYFKNMLDDIQKITRNKTCINASDDAILENYYRVLQHYIGLFDRINNINYDGPYIKLVQRERGGTNKLRKNKTKRINKKSRKNKTKRRKRFNKK